MMVNVTSYGSVVYEMTIVEYAIMAFIVVFAAIMFGTYLRSKYDKKRAIKNK